MINAIKKIIFNNQRFSMDLMKSIKISNKKTNSQNLKKSSELEKFIIEIGE